MNNRLLPPSSPSFLHHSEQGAQRLSELPIHINTLWNPDTCPAHLLPWLAWALSVDRWDETWSEEARRQIIRDSWHIHRHKGTISAMRRAVEPFGAILSITEWWENNAPPGSFRLDIDISERGLTEETRQEMERFVLELLAHTDIKYCPHGRPVAITLTRSEIEKQFGRSV